MLPWDLHIRLYRTAVTGGMSREFSGDLACPPGTGPHAAWIVRFLVSC